MTIININPSSQSEWIADTSIHDGDVNTARIGDIIVTFSRTVATASIPDSVWVVGPTGDVIDGALDPIDTSNDFNSITKRLTLHLADPLDKLSEYMLVIDGLYSPTGESQDTAHRVVFATNNLDVDLNVADDEPALVVQDKTDISRPLRIVDGEAGVSLFVRSLPTNGAYNLAPAYNQGVINLIFSANVGTNPDSHVLIERRIISTVETSFEIVGAAVTSNAVNLKQVDITLPAISEGVYLEQGYEYRVTAFGTLPMETGTLGSDKTIVFAGKLSPMMASVQNVLVSYPRVTSYDAARRIFEASTEVMDVVPNMDAEHPTRAASEYVLYMSLARLSDGKSSDSKSVKLGDLSIEKGSTSTSSWRSLANKAWAKLTGGGPAVGVKGGSKTSPFVTRDWNA
jgi:hypothetical protein